VEEKINKQRFSATGHRNVIGGGFFYVSALEIVQHDGYTKRNLGIK
jgi:hypothetical protein